MLRLINFLGLAICFLLIHDSSCTRNCNRRRVAYIRSTGTQPFTDSQAQSLTHINFAYLKVDAKGNITFVDNQSRKRFDDIKKVISKQRNPPKISFVIGGWDNSQYFPSLIGIKQERVTFVDNIVKTIVDYGFDGVEIDWIYPSTNGGYTYMNDRKSYVFLLSEIRQKLNKLKGNFVISFTVPSDELRIEQGYNMKKLLEVADFANIYTYDYYGPWSSIFGSYTGPVAPLYFGAPKNYSVKACVHETLKYLGCQLGATEKINMGIPFYGRSWKNVGKAVDSSDEIWRLAKSTEPNGHKYDGEFIEYRRLREKYDLKKTKFHDKSKTPYIWDEKKHEFFSYENSKSLKYKLDYVYDYNIGGIAISSIDFDDHKLPLLDALNEEKWCRNSAKKFNYKCN